MNTDYTDSMGKNRKNNTKETCALCGRNAAGGYKDGPGHTFTEGTSVG